MLKKISRIISTVLIILTIIIGSLWIVNQVTVTPTVSFLRWIQQSGEPFGDMGDYKDVIESVNDGRIINIDSDPNTSLVLYGSNLKQKKPLIFFIHGGGWSLGSSSDVSFYAKLLSSSGYIVANTDYALSPEYQYPISTHQLLDSLNYLYDNAGKYNIDRENIFIMGNSAGAHLSAQLGALLTNEDYAKEMKVTSNIKQDDIKGLILFNGVYNFRTSKDNKFPFFNSLTRSYTGENNIDNFINVDQMSPINYITEDFPNSMIVSGDGDPLKPQSIELSRLLTLNDVSYSLLADFDNKDLNHDFMFNLDENEAILVLQILSQFIVDNTQ